LRMRAQAPLIKTRPLPMSDDILVSAINLKAITTTTRVRPFWLDALFAVGSNLDLYGSPDCVSIISGIAAEAAIVIRPRKIMPTIVSAKPFTCLPMMFLSAATRRIG